MVCIDDQNSIVVVDTVVEGDDDDDDDDDAIAIDTAPARATARATATAATTTIVEKTHFQKIEFGFVAYNLYITNFYFSRIDNATIAADYNL